MCIYTYIDTKQKHTHAPSCNHPPKTRHQTFHTPQISLLPLSGQPLTHQPSKRQLLSDFYHHGFVLLAFVLIEYFIHVEMHNMASKIICYLV